MPPPPQSSSPSSPKPSLTHLSDLHPPSQDRAWLTAPHPRLPFVATCCADKSVRIYSLTNFALLSTISGGHKRAVRSCAWKPHVKGESVLATASFDATVGIWRRWDEGFENHHERNDEDADDEDEDEWGFAVLLDGHDSEVKSVAWAAAGGSLLATCSRDKSIWIWEDLEDGENEFETVAVLQEHAGDVKCVAWHPEEECLASGSYDDTIRLWREDVDDWGQVACLRAHEGTVWCVEWEGGVAATMDGHEHNTKKKKENACAAALPGNPEHGELSPSQREKWIEQRRSCGPRLVSCSDDRTIRIWRKQPPPQKNQHQQSTSSIPSTIRPASIDETWHEECQLPSAHDLSIYSVAWSKTTGLIASTGADGRIVVYQERFLPQSLIEAQTTSEGENLSWTKWEVVACIDAAHGIYEVNHVCWAKRADQSRSQQRGLNDDGMVTDSIDEEEVLLSTGDDGVVKVWRIER
ncbi:Cytosolic iron-sulfur protein assembly protein [Emydomyces testavorans]|uniref:Probable cytosolic iron-sulfur protein assembly protein 1 n=1 Tax=Emydomyces testavorans TaxID=2070801 RepID=A0AAF0DCA4_9EURO|nr:Cytosolic iron-sulfur protein assembly protein [Emydomyces testavorans]